MSDSEPAKKAVWMLQGGPGFASVGLEQAMTKLQRLLNGQADVYTMDHRGTGRSHILECDAAQAFYSGSPGGAYIDYREVPNCVKDVLFQIDNHTNAFSVTSAAKDVELLVKTLNKDQETFVYGSSYGTDLTARVMHLAPAEVKGYVLDGVWSESIGSFARFSSQRDEPGKYFASLCENNEVCKSKYAYGLEQHGDLFNAWRSTYDKLDEAAFGENECSDFLRGDTERLPSEVLRTVFSVGIAAGDTNSRHFIPAVFKMLDTCDAAAVEALAALLKVKPGQSVSELIKDAYKPPATFNRVTEASPLLMALIKASEMWTYPSPSWAEEKKAIEAGVFGSYSSNEFAWYCLLNGDMSDPSCDSLVDAGQDAELQADLAQIEPVKFLYERDEYYRKVATVPAHASVMVMNGKLDFQTIHSWAQDQYEKLVGRKLFVEFEFGPHCIALTPSTAGDTTDCGLRILSSYIEKGGDVENVDTSCMTEMPDINFDVEAELAQRIEAKKAAANATMTAHSGATRGKKVVQSGKHSSNKKGKVTHHLGKRHVKHSAKSRGKKHHHKN
ncbi:hypothetical protein P43SY_011778 [Pythium insidiosum]|uniref:AB hydrolase-1 domain-containing protein n=1 Tax=Pythium insidiosum TaxID=114742 RepID=A0AAD5L633_PYTIN|nr:hypothetical protein P43SY_011778 [Pythium insidiosum]